MPLDILVGLQYGDCGKGKVTDSIAENYDTVVRFNGGNNAGHTLKFDGVTLKLHSVPSGIAHENVLNIISRGCVVNPAELCKEIQEVEIVLGKTLGPDRFRISGKCHVITEQNILEDAQKSVNKIGTTGKGIGPTFSAKHARESLRLSDVISQYPPLKKFLLEDDSIVLGQLELGYNILAEGAQGTWLDIDHGEYPYVTSCNTLASHACTTLGVGINYVRDIIGVFKAYTTRVGNGTLSDEWSKDDPTYKKIFDVEVGTTTGRNRRCGPLDLPKLKKAIMMNGVTRLVMTKSDMLNGTGFEVIEDAIHVKVFEPWEQASAGDINFIRFIDYLEDELGIQLSAISNGPDREDYDYNHGLTREFMVK